MPRLLAEIVAIGDEMISGARLDTNTQWLSQRLGDLGLDVVFHTTVGDELDRNIDAFRVACQRADVVVATGGLGPTRDDLTRDAIAGALGVPLKMDEGSLQHIETLFKARGRSMPPRNQIQAMFPIGTRPISNPQGTAPGIDAVLRRDDGTSSRIFALPGVPAEMKSMFHQTVAPEIQSQSGDRTHLKHLVLKFFGVGESDMEQRLGDMIERGKVPRVGITVSSATISLRVTAVADSQAACDEQLARARADIMSRVGDLYFGEGESFEQYHAVDEQLQSRGHRLVLLELGHAAPLGDWMASLGSTPSFVGGLSMANLTDVCQLMDSQSMQDCLLAIAQRFDSNWVLAVDAYPEIDHASDRPMPAAGVRFWVCDPNGQIHQRDTELGGHPSIVQARIGKAALAYLRSQLTSFDA
ncbi:MAG: molybdopterin-binding protein [Planctomycetota bacterium]